MQPSLLAASPKTSDQPDDDARFRLRTEIQSLLTSYTDQETKPPFSTAELIVMATICSPQKSLSNTDILLWIISTFHFYSHHALYAYAACHPEPNTFGDLDHPTLIVENFHNIFTDRDVPLRTPSGGTVNGVDCFDVTCSPGPARIFLRKWLEPERKGSFRFLDLPAELRTRVYDLLFTFPSSGLCFSPYQPGLRLLHRDIDDIGTVKSGEKDWAEHGEWSKTPTFRLNLQTTFALLTVNKQLRVEATPALYARNRIYFFGLHHFCRFMLLTPERLKQLKKAYLTFEICGRALQDFVPAMAQAARALKLPELVLDIPEHVQDEWMGMKQADRELLGRKTKFTKYGQIRGMRCFVGMLAKVEALTFRREPEGMAAWIRDEVGKVREGGDVSRVKEKDSGGKGAGRGKK
ncbi:hypothetical protein LTR86_007903 [Recurvomyces mirabilis]|nr:hypothetical protein LTR86_007903 [Recurvomyces mirabilis]